MKVKIFTIDKSKELDKKEPDNRKGLWWKPRRTKKCKIYMEFNFNKKLST